MLDQREAPIPAAPAEEVANKPQSHIAAFNVGGLNMAPASNDETFELETDDPGTPDLFNEGGAGNKSADRKATEFTNEMGMSADVKLGNGGGSLSQLSLREIEERKRERSEEAFEALLEQIGEMQKQEERARKWDAEMHDFGGKKFSGQELMAMRDWLKNEDNQEEFENDLMKRQGISKEEARRRRIETQEALELKKRERDGTMTPEDRRRYNELMAKPEMRENVETLETLAKVDPGVDYQKDQKAGRRILGDQKTSIQEGASFFSEDSSVSSATAIPQIDTPLISVPIALKGEYNQVASGIKPEAVAAPAVAPKEPAATADIKVASASTGSNQSKVLQSMTATATF